jgi:NADPH-dependent methylglyoxal reductase
MSSTSTCIVRFPATYEMGASGQAPPFVVYLISKKYAELAVWDFGKEHPEMQLTVVLRTTNLLSIQVALINEFVSIATIIYGPMIHPISSMKNINASNAVIYALLNGILFPDSVPIFCDAVSAAKVHIKTLQSDSTIGKRVLFAKGPGTMYQILQIIKENRPELASRLPATPEAGDPLGGKPFVNIDSSIATKELGVSGLDLKETVLQTVDDLLRLEKELGTN